MKSGRETHFDMYVYLEDELGAAGISVRSCCTKELYEEEEKSK